MNYDRKVFYSFLSFFLLNRQNELTSLVYLKYQWEELKMKKYSIIITLLFLVPLFFSGCGQSEMSITKEEMKKIVEERNAQLGEYFKIGNADLLAAMYSDSAKFCPNGFNFIIGRDSIKVFWAEDFKTSKVVEMVTNVKTIDGNKDLIYETGITSSKILYNDSLYNVSVKYINIWRKQPDGQYLLDVDFWNSISR